MSTKSDGEFANDLWKALEASHKLVEHFEKKYGRGPTDAELRLAASIHISKERNAR